jgi:hypothetical protein
MRYTYLDIKIPISDEPMSRAILNKKDQEKLKRIIEFEGMPLGRFLAKLIKHEIEKKEFLFK